MVILDSYTSLVEGRGKVLRQILEGCIRFFGSEAKFVEHAPSILLGITRTPSNEEVTLDDLKDFMRENSAEVMQGNPDIISSLADRLFIFDPLNESLRDQCRDQVATLPSLNPTSIFENPAVALEDADSILLTDMSASIRNKFHEELVKARSYGFATDHLTPALVYLAMLEELHKVIPLQAVADYLEHAKAEAASDQSNANLKKFGWGILGIVGVPVLGTAAIVLAAEAAVVTGAVGAVGGAVYVAAAMTGRALGMATKAEEEAEAKVEAAVKVIGSVKAEAKNLQPRHSSSSKSRQQQESKQKK